MQFATNARCQGCSATIISHLQQQFPNARFDLDLDSADKVLHVHGIPEDAETAAKVISAIEATGFKGSWISQ